MRPLLPLALLLASLAASAAGPPPPYAGPACELFAAKATGFFRVEERDGRWWYVDPNGRPFYLVGTDHVGFDGHWCEKLGYAPYGRVAKAKYGDEQKWAAATIDRLKAWGFNALTAGNSESLRHRGLPHLQFASFGSDFAGHNDLSPKSTWTGFPNVWSPDWPDHCDATARRLCAPRKDDPWLIGYFLDNELEWYGRVFRDEGLFDEAWKKPATHTAKQAWVQFVKAHFGGDLAKINAALKTSFPDFVAMGRDTSPHTIETAEHREVARLWVRATAERYFRGCAEAIRRHDPNHLIVGCRFAGRAPGIWDVAGQWCDVVSLNLYPMIDVERGVPADVIDFIDTCQREAKKPMMLTEWGFPGLDAGLPSRHGAGMRVDTQEQRAQCFTHFQNLLFRLPYMVGSAHFMYLDEPAQGISTSFPEDSNYGLINGDDVPYPPITSAATKLNPDACRLHLEGGAKAAVIPPFALPGWMTDRPAPSAPPAGPVAFTTGTLVVRGPFDGTAWRLECGGETVGTLSPMIHQRGGGDRWTHPTSVRITGIQTNARVAIVEVEAATSSNDWNFAYAMTVRYRIPLDGSGWIAAQTLSIRNQDGRAWEAVEAFHYLLPAGRVDDIRPLSDVPQYYREVHGWTDPARQLALGCWFPPDSGFKAAFWRGDGGDLHPDLREPVGRTLQAGGAVELPGRTAFFFLPREAGVVAHGEMAKRIVDGLK